MKAPLPTAATPASHQTSIPALQQLAALIAEAERRAAEQSAAWRPGDSAEEAAYWLRQDDSDQPAAA